MATENKQSVARGKPSSNQDGSSKEKFDSSVKNKKIDSSNKHSTADFKPKSVSTVTKTEVPISKLVPSFFYCYFLFIS